MAYDDRALRGVGGWLAFFILTLTVFGPLRAIYQTYANLYGGEDMAGFYGANWVALQAVEWSLVAISGGISAYLGWRLYAVHQWRSVQLTIAGLWLTSPTIVLIDLIAVSLFSGMNFWTLLASIAGEFVRTMIYAAIWTAYLLRSRRVANTYARHADTDALGAVFD